MYNYKTSLYSIWEKSEDKVYMVDMLRPKRRLVITGELAQLWQRGNGYFSTDDIKSHQENINILVGRNWLVKCKSGEKESRRSELSMNNQLFIGEGVLFNGDYGIMNLKFDMLLKKGMETNVVNAIYKAPGIKTEELYNMFEFKSMLGFKLFIRRLCKLGIISSSIPIEQSVIRPKVFRIQFEITENCNLKCKHCYDERKQVMATDDEDKNTLIKIVDRLFELCTITDSRLELAISGGEPFVSPYLWDVLDAINKKSEIVTRVQILSNGTLVNELALVKLEKYSFVSGIQISLDGVTEATHDHIRGKGVYKKAVNAIKLIKSRKRKRAALHYVVHKGNLVEAYRLLDFGREIGADRITVTRLIPDGNAIEMSDSMLSPEETNELFNNLSETYNSNKRRYPLLAIERCDWPVTFTDGEKCTPLYNGYFCQVGRFCLDVRQNGDVYPCRRLPIKIGNILKDDLIEILNHDILWQFRFKIENSLLKGICKDCEFAVNPSKNLMCSGGAACISYGLYGDPFMPDPQCSVNIKSGKERNRDECR